MPLQEQPERPDGTGAHLLIFRFLWRGGKKTHLICVCASQVNVHVTACVCQTRPLLNSTKKLAGIHKRRVIISAGGFAEACEAWNELMSI